jgi:hexokinase
MAAGAVLAGYILGFGVHVDVVQRAALLALAVVAALLHIAGNVRIVFVFGHVGSPFLQFFG